VHFTQPIESSRAVLEAAAYYKTGLQDRGLHPWPSCPETDPIQKSETGSRDYGIIERRTVEFAIFVFSFQGGTVQSENRNTACIETKFSHNLYYEAHMIRRRNIVSCFGIVRIPFEHPGLPKGYKNPALGMLLSLCEVSVT
jgi:hypothetical protein